MREAPQEPYLSRSFQGLWAAVIMSVLEERVESERQEQVERGPSHPVRQRHANPPG